MTDTEIHVEEGSNSEFYTEEHEKLLGDSRTTWSLFIDGYDDEGQPIYDQCEGKLCLQCRYGENVVEVNESPDWICPVCQGICSCNCCRHRKGWAPIGAIYKKVHDLCFKSVAHYLIQTRRQQMKAGESDSENLVSANDSLSSASVDTWSESVTKLTMKKNMDKLLMTTVV